MITLGSRMLFGVVVVVAVASLCACEASEPEPRVLPVVVDGEAPRAFVTDLGHEVTLTSARVVVENLTMLSGGEAHAHLAPGALFPVWLVGSARAHPGHGEGGDALGALTGRFVVDLFDDGAPLGDAALLPATYDAHAFDFGRGASDDGLSVDDALLGASFALAGSVSTGEGPVSFDATVALDDDAAMTGGRFALTVDDDTDATLALRFSPRADDGATILDGVDAATLGSGPLAGEAKNRVTRALQEHVHWDLVVR